MSHSFVVHNELELDQEVKQYRAWWAMDPRIAGNPLTVLLYYRCFRSGAEVTQQQAMDDLELARTAFRSAKLRLRGAGFLVEVRDRYPHDYRDTLTGEPRGGQKRYQLWFLDPEPGIEVPVETTLIEADEPVDRVGFGLDALGGTKRTPAAQAGGRNVHRLVKPQISQGGRNVHPGIGPVDNLSAEGRNVHPLKENTGLVRSGLEIEDSKPDQTVAGARASAGVTPPAEATPPSWDEGKVDVMIAGLHPDLVLTVGMIRSEIEGRVDLTQINVYQAVLDTVILAASKGNEIRNPAQYVASSIVKNPGKWLLSARPVPFAPLMDEPLPDSTLGFESRASGPCAPGEHDWGPPVWPEFDRSQCMLCDALRRDKDPEWAARAANDFEGSTR